MVGGEHTGQLHEPPLGALGAPHGAQAAGASEGGGHAGALLRETLAREDGGDVFLLQLSGRQVVHAYQGPKLPQGPKDLASGPKLPQRPEAKLPQGPEAKLQAHAAAARHQQKDDGGAAVHARAQEGGGMVEEPDERAEERVEGMVVGEELDERDMFTTLLRPGDTLYIPRGWVYESTTNTSFLESPSKHVAIMACVAAVSWQTVVHAAIKVVAEEEEVVCVCVCVCV